MAHLYKQVFKSLQGALKRCAFENYHRKDGERGNVNYRFFVVRCVNGVPDKEAYVHGRKYDYRLEKTLKDYPTDPRTFS